MTPARLPCSWAVANKHSGCESKTAHVEVSTIGGHEYPMELPRIDNMCGQEDHPPSRVKWHVTRRPPVTTPRTEVSFTTDNTNNTDILECGAAAAPLFFSPLDTRNDTKCSRGAATRITRILTNFKSLQ